MKARSNQLQAFAQLALVVARRVILYRLTMLGLFCCVQLLLYTLLQRTFS